jgi:RNA polymerase-binding transcription factor
MSAIDTERFRTMLQEERKRVQDAIDYLHSEHPGSLDEEVEEISAGSDNHLAETATATLDRELDYSLEENSEQVLSEIDAALKRIEDGTYGICTKRGEQIPVERLEARPWASLCIDCAREAERG